MFSKDRVRVSDATAQVIHALIIRRLDLCNIILYNLPNNKM